MPTFQFFPRLRNHYAISEVDFAEHLRAAGTALSKGLWLAITLGIPHILYDTWRYIPEDFSTLDRHGNTSGIYLNKWEDVVCILTKVWSMSSLGCTLLVPLSVGLLQIDSVRDACLGRTATIAAFIFSAAGLLSSTIFMFAVSHFDNEKCREIWIKTSNSFKDSEYARMACLFAFPFSALIWSMIFFSVTILIQLAWNIGGASDIEGANRAGDIISGTFVMALTLILIIPVWRGILLAKELSWKL